MGWYSRAVEAPRVATRYRVLLIGVRDYSEPKPQYSVKWKGIPLGGTQRTFARDTVGQ